MKTIILSDLHLKFSENAEDKARRTRVLNFLKSLIGKTDILILNGDIFDLWFAWNSVIIKSYFPVLKILADIQESGCKLHFISGNHDFWFRDFLKDYLKMEIHKDSLTIKVEDKTLFVSHGDLYTANDMRYKIFRKVIRNKLVMWIFELIHPDLALGLGKNLSRSSRNRTISPELKRAKEAGLENFAKLKLRNSCDFVVFGHSHSPISKQFEGGIYINSGDWIVHNTYVEIEDGRIQLKVYENKE